MLKYKTPLKVVICSIQDATAYQDTSATLDACLPNLTTVNKIGNTAFWFLFPFKFTGLLLAASPFFYPKVSPFCLSV